MNQPCGFKCPSCAFPDADCTRKLEFCENGAKALAHEATKFRVTRDFFARHSVARSEEHTSELQSLMRISYAVFCLKIKKHKTRNIIATIYSQRRREAMPHGADHNY